MNIEKQTFIHALQSTAYRLSKSINIDIGPNCVVDTSWPIEKQIEIGRILAFWDLAACVKVGALLGEPGEPFDKKAVRCSANAVIKHLHWATRDLAELYQFDVAQPFQRQMIHRDLACTYGRFIALNQLKARIDANDFRLEGLV